MSALPGEEPVQYGVVEQVSPLVRRVLANNPGPFTFRGTGTYLVGRGEVAIIDPGPDDPAHVAALLAALEPGERVTHLVITHTHSDHSPAAVPMHEHTGAPTYGFGPQRAVPDATEEPIVFGDPEADADPEADKQDEGADRPPPSRGDPMFRPDVLLRDGDVLEADGWRLEAVHTPGHASNHLCYRFAPERAVFTGDHVMGWSTSVISPPDGDLGEYLASLEKLLAFDDARYIPTHGPVVDDPHALVRSYLAHRRQRSEEVLAALDRGPGTLVSLVPRIYAETSKRLWRAAAGSMYAHLLHLRALGEVEASDDPPRRSSTWWRAGGTGA